VLTLDGTGDFVQISHASALNTSNWTLEAWFQTTAHAGSTDSDIGRLISKAQATGGNQYGLYIRSGKINFVTNSLDTNTITTTDTYNDGKWHHAAGVYDGSTLKLYIDGQEVVSANATGTAPVLDTNDLLIGAYEDGAVGGAEQYFNGNIDDVRIWSDARTEAEIQEHMHKTLTGSESGLLANYTFDDDDPGAGNTIQSATGSHNGTGQAGATVLPVGSQGNTQVLSLDGTSDYVSLSTGSGIHTGTSNFTWEAWVKSSTTSGRMEILAFGNNVGNQGAVLLIQDSKLRFDLAGVAGTNSTSSVADGTWHHVAVTYNQSTDVASLYIDGAAAETHTFTGAALNIASGAANIGVSLDNAASPFNGQIDDVRVWNTLRTATEIADNYKATLSGTEGGALIAHYTFDGDKTGTGQTITDTAGTSTGTGQGDATVAAITAGEETVRAVASTPVQSNAQIVNLPAKALDFDGTNDSVAVADPGTAFTNMTIEAWVHLDTLTTGVDNKMLIGNQGWTTAGDLHLQWVVNDGKKKLSWGENGNVNHFAHDFTNDLNKWQHIAVVRDTDAKELRLYLDGDLVDSITFTTSATVRLDDSTTIGKIAGGNRYLDGQLSDFRVWQTARTGDEIKANYAQTLTGNENGELIINYPMDEVSGSTLADTAGTANNGTVTSATIVDVGNTVLGTKITITEGETATGTMTSNDVTGTATYSITSNPTLGSVVIDSTSGQWTYTPPENYAGSQTFSVRATGGGLTDTETVTVTISADAENAVHAGALQFDGVNDYVDITGATSVYTGTSNFTWEAWINTSSSGLRQDIISIGNHAQNETAFFFVNDVGKLQVDLPYQGGAASTTSVNDGNWHHVALTMNAASKVATLYIDGTADGSKTFTGNALNLVQGDGAFIGGVISSDNTYFKGMIDEVRIWNTLRTAQQISDNKDEQISSSQANLVAHYQMDDVKGGIVHDATSNAGHGALNGPGPSPGVLTLDGTDDYLDVPDAVLNNLSAGTIETWVFLDTNTSETITSKQHDGVNTTAVFSVGDSFGGTAGKLHFRPYNGQSAVGSATVATGEWVHVAVTFNSSEARFYVNGTLDSTASGNFSIPNIANATATTIGNMVTGSGTYIGTGSVNSSLDGKMDEVRIWSDVRTATEIRDNMNQAIEGPSPNLVAVYSFDRDATGSTGTVLNEQGTTALNGTRTNGATVEKSETAPVNEMPKPLNGVTGNVLVLDGSNDYVDVANLGTGAITGAFTMEAWVKPDKFDAYAVVIDLFGGTAGETGLQISDTGVFNAWFTGSNTNVASTYKLSIGEWSHLAVAFDGANTAKLYANGELVATNTSITMTTLSGDINMHIGMNDGTGENHFDGQVDNARVWSVERTEAQIREGMSESFDYNTTGLLAQYNFEDVVGTTVKDNTLTSTNGTLTGGATVADSGSGEPFFVNHLGTALTFDGSDDVVNFGGVVGPTGASERTIMLWAKTSSSSGQEFLRYGSGNEQSFALGLNGWADAGGGQGVTIDIASRAITFQPLTATDDGQWHHYAVVLPSGSDKLTELRVYQDGVLLETVSKLASDVDGTINTTHNGVNFRLGTSGISRYFNGQMAEVSVWSTALTTGQIKDYMTHELAGTETGLSAYWKLDEGTGTSVADSSNNANTGTIAGSAAWASTAPDIQGSLIEIAEDTSASGKMTSTDVSGTATYTVVGSPQNGTVNLDSSTGHWTYTPNTDYQGTDSFTLRASGATSGIDDETVSVSVGKAPALIDNFAMSFDGTGDFIDLGTDSDFVTGSSNFTIEAWIKTSYTAARQDIFSFGAGSTNDDAGFFYVDATTGNLRYGQSFVLGPTGGADGAWHHVAVTNTSETMQLYIDGVASGTSQAMSPAIATGVANIGRSITGTGYFNGEIDEVRFWDKARTQSEIQADMDRQLNGDEANLAGYWNFNEGSGLAANDASGNSLDGSLQGDATFKNLTTIPVSSGATYKGMILGEDADADGLTYTLATAPEDHNGTFTLDGNKYTYTNDGDEGDDFFTVTITDEHGETTTETITFNVS